MVQEKWNNVKQIKYPLKKKPLHKKQNFAKVEFGPKMHPPQAFYF
jgi:hypothetical protein